MQNLDAFLRLSHYLKCYQLYEKFAEVDNRNRTAIENIEKNCQGEQPDLTEYHQVLNKVEFNNKLLEANFNNYDFSDEEVEQALTDYEVYAFEFIVDTITTSMEGKQFKQNKDVINHVRTAEKVVYKHFIKRFYLIEGLNKIFEKASDSILEQALDWSRPIPQEENVELLK